VKPDSRSLHDRPFEGGAFHPQFSDGRAHGLVHLDHQAVRFESEKGEFTLPLAGLKLELGGASDRLIFLTHPEHPQVTVHSADHALLLHPVIEQTPSLASQRAAIRGRQRATSLVLLSLVGLVAVFVAGLFFARGWMVESAARAVPIDWEIRAGNTLYEQVVRGKREIKDPEVLQQLGQITGPLVAGIPDQRYPLTFHVVEDATLNAFAMPGGHVVLFSGLLLAADRSEEVAGVLAHEIAHVTRRHSIRNIISSAGLYLILSALVGDATGIVAVLANNSAYLLDRKFSRDFEREADDTGWEYLIQSDIEPRGMIEFFQKMQQEEDKRRADSPMGGMEQALEAISTHPATQERLDRLERRWSSEPRQSGYRNIPLNYPAFKASLRGKLHGTDPANP
jgi:predicted Zn-dependent protease